MKDTDILSELGICAEEKINGYWFSTGIDAWVLEIHPINQKYSKYILYHRDVIPFYHYKHRNSPLPDYHFQTSWESGRNKSHEQIIRKIADYCITHSGKYNRKKS